MEVKQVATLMNAVTKTLMGENAIQTEDLSNVVDMGTAIFGAASVDKYVATLVDHIGRMIFVNRKYAGGAPSVLMDGWEYGAVCEKIRTELPEAEENDTWNLQDGQSYDPNVFTAPVVGTKFFDKRVTFDVKVSFTDKQVKSAFDSAGQLNAFISMIYTAVDNSMTVKLDALIMRTINNMIAETIHAEYGATELNSKSTVKAVNLLKLYNTAYTKTLTAAEAVLNPDFIRFAAYQMGMYEKRMRTMSKLFNIGKKERFTPADRLHVVLLSDFESAANVYLQSDTFHNEFTALPNAESVAYWQGPGENYEFASTSKINVKDASKDNVEVTGVLGVMFDRDALGVTCMNRRTTAQYNARAEFTNNWFKMDAGYFNDPDEQCVVFFAA